VPQYSLESIISRVLVMGGRTEHPQDEGSIISADTQISDQADYRKPETALI